MAGLDIRPESLPDDVASSAQQLWDQGQRRAAIALLYRASLARLVERHGLHINKGATEQDCPRLSEQLIHTQETEAGLQQCFASCTEVWLKAAYAHVFPNSINSLCQQWRQHLIKERQYELHDIARISARPFRDSRSDYLGFDGTALLRLRLVVVAEYGKEVAADLQ